MLPIRAHLIKAAIRYAGTTALAVGAVCAVKTTNPIFAQRPTVNDIVKLHAQPPAEELPNTKCPRIAVIDNFIRKNKDLDQDGIHDTTHGDIVFRFLEEGLPNADIAKFDIDEDLPFLSYAERVGRQLEKLIKLIEKGEKFDVVNLSFSFNRKFTNDITPDNILSHRNAIISQLAKGDYFMRGEARCVTLIEKLHKMGVKVYIGAGNAGKGEYNVLSLAQGTITVGGLNEDGTKADFSADNTYVTRWNQSVFSITKTENGIDFTGNDIADMLYEDLSAAGENLVKELFGTSFAAPTAIIEDFKNCAP